MLISIWHQNKEGKLGIKNMFGFVSDCSEKDERASEFCQCVLWAKDKTGTIPAPSFGDDENGGDV